MVDASCTSCLKKRSARLGRCHGRGDCGQVESIHSKSGETVEIFEACVERVLPFLQQNMRPRCSHVMERKGEQDACYMLRTANNKGSYMEDSNTRDAFLGLRPCLGPVMSLPRSHKAQIQYQSGRERNQFQASLFPFEGSMKSPEEWKRMEQVQ